VLKEFEGRWLVENDGFYSINKELQLRLDNAEGLDGIGFDSRWGCY